MEKEPRGMTIRELEKRSGVRRSTIHHYVQYGLLHQPFKTGKTMAYYDETHLQRLEKILKIKMNYLKKSKTTRVPLDHIIHELQEGYTLTKKKIPSGGQLKDKNEIIHGKKEEIIKAALKRNINRGYYLTNIREITKEVGISAPTFYHYFQDKRELFVEAITYVMRKYRQELEEAVEKEPDSAKRSLIMLKIFSENYPKIGEILNQLRAGVAIGDQWSKERLSQLYDDMTESLTKRIRILIEKGLMRDVDPELLAFLNVMLDEIAIHRSSLDDKYSLNQIMKFIADMLYHAFLTEKGKKAFRALNVGEV